MLTMLETETLQITEVFASVQGETHLAGLPTTFIRLSACNLRCSWCDTPYSFGRGSTWTFEQLENSVVQNGCRHVCITGGEPLLQHNVHALMSALCDKGYTLSLETGGSLPIEEVDSRVIVILDVKCPGSGMAAKNDLNNLQQLKEHDEVKFVLLDRRDYEFAQSICDKYSLYQRKHPILFSPVHGKLDPKELSAWIIEDQLPVRLNLQIHKYIWTPETKGV